MFLAGEEAFELAAFDKSAPPRANAAQLPGAQPVAYRGTGDPRFRGAFIKSQESALVGHCRSCLRSARRFRDWREIGPYFPPGPVVPS